MRTHAEVEAELAKVRAKADEVEGTGEPGEESELIGWDNALNWVLQAPARPVSETTAETSAQAFCDLAFPHGADATNADEYRALYNGYVAGWIARGPEDGAPEPNGGIDITGLLG